MQLPKKLVFPLRAMYFLTIHFVFSIIVIGIGYSDIMTEATAIAAITFAVSFAFFSVAFFLAERFPICHKLINPPIDYLFGIEKHTVHHYTEGDFTASCSLDEEDLVRPPNDD